MSAQIQPIRPLSIAVTRPEAPLKTISGIEIRNIKGPHTVHYPWRFLPSRSAVHPDPRLWSPMEQQSYNQILEQNRILEEVGSGADVLSYNVHHQDNHNHWMRVYFNKPELDRRPFYPLLEFDSSKMVAPINGGWDMSHPANRAVFLYEIRWLYENVILPNQSRAVTLDGKFVVYLWSVVQMQGNFAELMDIARARYPVKFIGSINIMAISTQPHQHHNWRGLDGFMEYAVMAPRTGSDLKLDFNRMVALYRENSIRLRGLIDVFEDEIPGKRYLFIPTFQSAYDESKIPGRRGLYMYPKTLADLEEHARQIIEGMEIGLYERLGPLIVWGELEEGAAAIPSRCLPEHLMYLDRFVGCGTVRAEVIRKWFK